MKRWLSIMVLCTAIAAQSPTSNVLLTTAVLTGTGQTGPPIRFSSATAGGIITVTGSGLSAATFGIMGSADGGITYVPVAFAAIAVPGTPLIFATVSGPALFVVNLAGLTHIQFVTSGTFTATNLSLSLTVSPNATASRGGGGASGPTTTTLTGDATGTGTGTVATTLATVGTAQTVGDATHALQLTTDAKGRVTAVTALPIPSTGSGLTSAQTQTIDLALRPAVVQLFDPARAVTGVLVASGGGANTVDGGFGNYYTSAPMPVVAGKVYCQTNGATDSNGLYGNVWLDANQNYVSAGNTLPIANGSTSTAPTGAVYARITSNVGSALTQMFVQGVCPSVYIPFQPARASYSVLNNLNFGVNGDSISNGQYGLWQPTVTARTGAREKFRDSRPGRYIAKTFECYGATTVGATLSTNQGSVTTDNGTYQNTGTPGNTLAQDLAGLTVFVIEEGTNDTAKPIGTLGDSTTTDTFYGGLNYVYTTLTTANPTMRIIYMTPYPNNYANATSVAAAEKAFAASRGAPVIDLWTQGGIYSGNWATTLQGDQTHPTSYSYSHLIGPYASSVMEMFN